MSAFSRLKRYIKPTTEVQLLLDGYIRVIQTELDDRTQIIPLAIIEICLIFYYDSKLLLCASYDYKTEKATFIISDIHSDKDNKVIFSKYIKTPKTLKNDKIKIPLFGNCLTTEFKSFPSQLSSFNEPRSFPILIFNIGSDQSDHKEYNNAFILDLNDWEIHDWKLPYLRCVGSTPLFLPKYQSLIVCGENTNVNCLCFNTNDTLQWDTLSPMHTSRSNAISIPIGNNKLMIIGGNTNKHEIYDVDKNEWDELSPSSIIWKSPGAVYNDVNKDVYVSGVSGTRKIEHYDFHKNKWDVDSVVAFKDYYSNDMRSVLWLEDNKILYVASIPSEFKFGRYLGSSNGTCEYIDLRINKKWECVYKKDMLHTLFKQFTRNNVDLSMWVV